VKEIFGPKSRSTKTDKSNIKRSYPNIISTKQMDGIISAISNNWKQIIMGKTMIHDLICNEIAAKAKKEN